MTYSAQTPSSRAPRWRTPALIGGVLLLAVIAGLLFALLIGRQPGSAGGSPSPTASPSATPSAPASPSADPSPSEEPAPTEDPEPTPVPAPEEWTLVHQFGDGSTRWAGGEIAFGDAGFLAIGRRYEGGHGGPHIAEYSMWQSPDGQAWTQVQYPAPGDGGRYDPSALSAAADGSYVLHALHFMPDTPGTSLVSLRSTDGVTWEPISTGLPAEIFVQSVEDGGPAGYLLVGGQGRNVNPTLWLSTDALTWELVHEFSQDTHYMQIQDADAGAEGYVVMGRRIEADGPYERFALASGDGREWVEQRAPFGPDDQTWVYDVAVTSVGGDWLATMATRDELITFYSSADGLEWTANGGTLQGNERSLASPALFEELGDQLIISPGATVSEAGTPGTWSSTDGTTWSPVDLGADAFLGKLAFGDGVVAVTGTIPGSGEPQSSVGGIWIRASD